MKKLYTCINCGSDYPKSQMEAETLDDQEGYLCTFCADQLAEDGRDAVDPDHNFESYEDWDENGR
ncbi:hypothetical protein GCM10025878_02200 [Leuconostoc gasicomitatum]|nr:hypothetical protein GCM10025878_02200 [Leuconostoc gasicomitatum]